MIHVAKYEPDRTGGGWTFTRNLTKVFPQTDYQEAKIYFIAGASMVQRDEVIQAKRDGKKIVLRVDNVLKNSRNRGTGMTRMKDFAELADEIVYQSKWAQSLLSPYLGKTGNVILNSTDEEIFNAKGRTGFYDQPLYGYVRFNRDETKNWDYARYYFSKVHQKNPEAKLWIVGNFSQETIDYNFDFYAGENWSFKGIQPPRALADLYRQIDYLIVPYINDACSNTLIEGLMSGCTIAGHPFTTTGGSKEILEAWQTYGEDYFKLSRMTLEYAGVIHQLLS